MEFLEEVEESEKGEKKNLLTLALKNNKYILGQFWKFIKTKDKNEQISKFVHFSNLMFDIISIGYCIFFLHDKSV